MWGFRENIQGINGIGLLRITTTRRMTMMCRTTSTSTIRTITVTMVFQLWDLIVTEDIKEIFM